METQVPSPCSLLPGLMSRSSNSARHFSLPKHLGNNFAWISDPPPNLGPADVVICGSCDPVVVWWQGALVILSCGDVMWWSRTWWCGDPVVWWCGVIAPKASAEGACILSKMGYCCETWSLTVVVVTVMMWVLVYGSYIQVANLGVAGDTFWRLLLWWCECWYMGHTYRSQIWG